MLKKIFVLMILLMFVAGCGGIQPPQKKGGEIIYSVTDASRQKLSFYEKPQRIVSLNTSVDEILLDLVDSKRIAALSLYADDESLCSATHKAKIVKGRAQASNLESVLAMQPDLVIIPDYAMNIGLALRSAGIKVYICTTPDSMEDIFKFIRNIGAAVGDTQASEALVSKLVSDLEKIRSRVIAKVPPEKRLKVLGLSFMGPMGMKGTFGDLCYYSGTTSALEGIDIPHQGTLSEEKMLELNPDMIITPSWSYSEQGDPEKFRQKILQNPVYANINAIKNNKVVQIHDNYLVSTSQYTYKAVEELALAAYPEVFK